VLRNNSFKKGTMVNFLLRTRCSLQICPVSPSTSRPTPASRILVKGRSWAPRTTTSSALAPIGLGRYKKFERRGVEVLAGNGQDFDLFSTSTKPIQEKKDTGVGIFWLLVVNFALFALGNWAGQGWVKSLYLNGANPQWWQFVTCIFCHYSWSHLTQNAFFLYVFGKFVEEEEGAVGVWATYLICGIGGAIASYLLGGARGFSLGASGAVFGLFAVSVLVKLQFNFRKLLEFGILGQFVFQQLATEVKNQAAVASTSKLGSMVAGGVQVSHVAHIGGALVGALLVLILSRIPEPE